MARFVGIISKVNTAGKYGFIKRNSITGDFGLPPRWNGVTKDVFLHQDDCGSPLVADMQVEFSVEDDPKRENAYRAKDAWDTSSSAVAVVRVRRPGIDLHVNQTYIDNPGVPVRWCFSPEMHQHVVNGLKEGNGYGILLIARMKDTDDQGFYETREIRDPFQPMSIITFRKPGLWTVGAVLFERTRTSGANDTSHLLKQSMQSFLEKSGNPTLYKRSIKPLVDISFEPYGAEFCVDERDSRSNGVAISLCEIGVHVPAEVFAPEPPQAAKDFANYFFKQRAGDECDFRKRIMIMTLPGFGFIPWALLEVVKRVIVFGGGIITSLLLIKGSHKTFLHTFAPSVDISFIEAGKHLEEDENGDFVFVGPWNRKKGVWFTPGALLAYTGLMATAAWIWSVTSSWLMSIGGFIGRFASEHSLLVSIVGIILFLIVASFAVWRARAYLKRRMSLIERHKHEERIYTQKQRKDTLRAEASKRSMIAAGTSRALIAERHADLLVCGDAPLKVELKALPPEMKTVGLRFRALKRAVCRPFA